MAHCNAAMRRRAAVVPLHVQVLIAAASTLVLIAFQYATCVPVVSVRVLSQCDASAVSTPLETVLVCDTGVPFGDIGAIGYCQR